MGATISEVAKEAGVSVGTVSRVFHRNPSVNADIAEKVNITAHKLGYVPRQSSKEDTIALMIEQQESTGTGGYLSIILEALVGEAHKRNLRVDVFQPSDFTLLRNGFLAAAISLLYRESSLSALPNLSDLPVVSLKEITPSFHSVCMNERQGVELALNYLIDAGHKRIGYLSLHDELNWARSTRETAMREILEDRNLPLFKEQFQNVSEPLALAHYLNKLLYIGKPTAILLPGENTAVQVMRNLNILGKQLPEELSLIGHESRYVSKYFSPPLTCLAQDPEAISQQAFALLDSINNGENKKRQRFTVDYQLIERDSVMPPKL